MRRVATLMRTASVLLGILLAACYGVGRLVTDEWHTTQYLFWTPSLAYMGTLGVLTLLALVTRRRRRASSGARSRRNGGGLAGWRVLALLLLGVLAHTSLFEWRAYRYVTGLPSAPPERTIRVMHWNMTYTPPYFWDRYITGVGRAPRPDVLVVTNPTLKNDLDQMAAALGPEYTAARCGIFAVFTRFPILERASATLGVPAALTGRASPPGMTQPDADTEPRTDYLPEWSPIPRTGSNMYDPGYAMCVHLDATAALGREVVLWGVDLPSQPRAWRMQTSGAAAERLDLLLNAAADAPHKFDAPDIILGDCNTPRGSASLRLISRGFPHAFDQAGRGPVASWPRRRALFHIDHIFVGPGLRAVSYRTLDLGISEHRAQTAEITLVP